MHLACFTRDVGYHAVAVARRVATLTPGDEYV
jgi:hypothetical protein